MIGWCEWLAQRHVSSLSKLNYSLRARTFISSIFSCIAIHFDLSTLKLILVFSFPSHCRLNQPPLSGNGSNALGGRHLHPTLSPDSDSDSDSDISLGTHSPIPSMTSQHSPNSSSGLNDRDLDRLAEEHRDPRGEKDYRNFASLQSFRFGEHINVAGFTSELPAARQRIAKN